MKNMILLLALAAAFGLAGCSSDKTTLNDQSGRITDLELRMYLNEQLDTVQSQLIQQNADAISAEAQARQDGDSELQDLLDQEEQARIAGDAQSAAQLSQAVIAQTIVNAIVQGQLALINSKFGPINTKLTSLQNQINQTNTNLSALQTSLGQLQVDLANLELAQQASESQLDSLQAQLLALQAQVDALEDASIKVYKCNSSQSKENIFKIGGKFYAAMNRVTTETVQVVTGSTSQTIVTPKLCVKDGDKFKLPGGNGNCPSSYDVVAGSGVTTTVPAYTTANKTVVTSVAIDLEQLVNGSYSTTDGQTPCSFSINNGVATNLVQVQ